MLPVFFILFTVLPILELTILIKVGHHIGAANTILIILLTGIVGASLAKYQGLKVLQNIQKELANGRLPDSELLDGVLILIGGILLLAPGFITDLIGFFLLFPLTRRLSRFILGKYFKSLVKSGQMNVFTSQSPLNQNRDSDIIDI